MTLKDEFLFQFRGYRGNKLVEIDTAFDRAFKSGDQTGIEELRALRTKLLDFPATVKTEDRAELVAVWPKELPALPQWFIDPEEAKRLDPPGEPCVVDLSVVKPEPDIIPPDIQATIVERRRVKSVQEDIDRPLALARAAEVRAELERIITKELQDDIKKLAGRMAETGVDLKE